MMSGENDQILSDETIIAGTRKKHSLNITKKLKLILTETEAKEFFETVTNTV